MNFSFLPEEVKFYDYFEQAAENLVDSTPAAGIFAAVIYYIISRLTTLFG